MSGVVAATLFARLTPPGRGAVAVIRVAGKNAVAVCKSHFSGANGKPLFEQPIGRIVFGRWGDSPGEELVVCRITEQELEVHCHGGHAAVQRIAEALIADGCREISWQRYPEKQTADPVARLAVELLSQATTERTAMILLDQLNGAFAAAMEQIDTAISAGNKPVALEMIDRLLQWAPLGLHLTQPWRVVLAGPPNVGKSSLINALVGFRRSMVFDQPGTTRDVVTATTAFGGWPVELSDTAGLRVSTESIEAAGIERTQQQLTSADLVVLTFDVSQPWTTEHQTLCNVWPNALVVYNKGDLGAIVDVRPAGISVSALNTTGIELVAESIISRLLPVEPRTGEAVPIDQAAVDMLRELRSSITS